MLLRSAIYGSCCAVFSSSAFFLSFSLVFLLHFSPFYSAFSALVSFSSSFLSSFSSSASFSLFCFFLLCYGLTFLFFLSVSFSCPASSPLPAAPLCISSVPFFCFSCCAVSGFTCSPPFHHFRLHGQPKVWCCCAPQSPPSIHYFRLRGQPKVWSCNLPPLFLREVLYCQLWYCYFFCFLHLACMTLQSSLPVCSPRGTAPLFDFLPLPPTNW